MAKILRQSYENHQGHFPKVNVFVRIIQLVKPDQTVVSYIKSKNKEAPTCGNKFSRKDDKLMFFMGP